MNRINFSFLKRIEFYIDGREAYLYSVVLRRRIRGSSYFRVRLCCFISGFGFVFRK